MAGTESRLIVSQEEGGVSRIGFVDRNILEEAAIQQIGDEVAAIIERSTAPKLLLNFQNVEHLSSAALGTLITINNKVKQRGGQLRLCSIDPQIYEVFVITKLNKLFQILETPEDALATFK
ncbi:MAG: STAS domain-containing protein [Phycisphaeraceae bacterium]|nr:STAS domain-containing protein [Phycisphaeraceae bacterium]